MARDKRNCALCGSRIKHLNRKIAVPTSAMPSQEALGAFNLEAMKPDATQLHRHCYDKILPVLRRAASARVTTSLWHLVDPVHNSKDIVRRLQSLKEMEGACCSRSRLLAVAEG